MLTKIYELRVRLECWKNLKRLKKCTTYPMVMFYSIWVLISWDILFVSAQIILVRDTHFTHYFIQNVKIFVFYLLTFRMPEHVLLPIQKFKELVDYTKRVNDIITGFIRKKPKNENPEEQQKQEVKSRKRKIFRVFSVV